MFLGPRTGHSLVASVASWPSDERSAHSLVIVIVLEPALAAVSKLDFVVAFDLDLELAGWLAVVGLAVERVQGCVAVALALIEAVAVEVAAVVVAVVVVEASVEGLVMIGLDDSLSQREGGVGLAEVVWLVPVPGSQSDSDYLIVIEPAAWQLPVAVGAVGAAVAFVVGAADELVP